MTPGAVKRELTPPANDDEERLDAALTLSRYAENVFWMGRYAERAESLLRLLAVTEAFAADQDGDEAWTPILKVFADEKSFEDRGKPLTPLNVARFYLSDKENANSVVNCVAMVKDNARPLRHLISTETWRQTSVLAATVEPLVRRRFAISKLTSICEEARIACLTHRGVIDATCYQDEVWLFYLIGSALESADQMTRLIDRKYFRYDREDPDAAAPPDVSWWNTLLRSASSYHAFQRRHSFNARPEDAAAFLLFDPRLPRSVAGAAGRAFAHLKSLDADFGAKAGREVDAARRAFEERLDARPSRLTGRPLHRYLDEIQQEVIALANAVADRYF